MKIVYDTGRTKFITTMGRLWLALLISLLSVGIVNGQDPEITENILPVVKRIGVTAVLDCIVINQQVNPVFWTMKAFQMVLTENDKIIIDPIHNTVLNGFPKYQIRRQILSGQRVMYSLIINRLEPRDSGWYTCSVHIRGSGGNSPHKDGELVVMVPPAVLQGSTSNTVSVKEGDAIDLTCAASGYPTPNITWVRVNGQPLPVGTITHRGGVLPIESVRKSDRGIYRCLADNAVRPPARHDVTLNVFFSPIAAAVQSSYGQAANRMFDMTIECRIAGFPQPELQWFKEVQGGNWVPMRITDKHKINILLNHANSLGANERWYQLVILSVQANDFGLYVCQGTNSYGSGHAYVKLFETSECQGANCVQESRPEGSAQDVTSCLLLVLLLQFFVLTNIH